MAAAMRTSLPGTTRLSSTLQPFLRAHAAASEPTTVQNKGFAPLKAFDAMVISPASTLTVASLAQPEKAFAWMAVTPAGIVTSVRRVLPLKAFLPMATTVSGIVTALLLPLYLTNTPSALMLNGSASAFGLAGAAVSAMSEVSTAGSTGSRPSDSARSSGNANDVSCQSPTISDSTLSANSGTSIASCGLARAPGMPQSIRPASSAARIRFRPFMWSSSSMMVLLICSITKKAAERKRVPPKTQ